MSNVSSGSSGSSKALHRVTGIPKKCWCGASIVAKMSKSEANPFQRYYRCGFTVVNKLFDDKHIFKWFDDAVVNELETLANAISRVETDFKEMASYHQKIVLEKVSNEVFDNVEELIGKARRMKIIMLGVVVIGFVSLYVIKFV